MDKTQQIKDFLSLDFSNLAAFSPISEAKNEQIKVFGEIYEFSLFELDRQLKEAQNENLEILINSGGGSVFDGVAMANLIKRHEGRTITNGIGLVASIASVVLLSADVAKMDKDAFLMIHNAWSYEAGEAEELRKTADILDKISNQIAEIYTAKTEANNKLIDGDRDKTKKKYKKMMSRETWLTAAEALELGLIDEVTDTPNKEELNEKEIKNLISKYANRAPVAFLNKFVMNTEENKTENKELSFLDKLKNLFVTNPEKIQEIKNEVEAEAKKEETDKLEAAKELLLNNGFTVLTSEEVNENEEKLNLALNEVSEKNTSFAELETKYNNIMSKLKEFENEASKPSGQTEYNNEVEEKKPTAREEILKRVSNMNLKQSRFFNKLNK
jgi:ATP-dependent Clp protease protease subunit